MRLVIGQSSKLSAVQIQSAYLLDGVCHLQNEEKEEKGDFDDEETGEQKLSTRKREEQILLKVAESKQTCPYIVSVPQNVILSAESGLQDKNQKEEEEEEEKSDEGTAEQKLRKPK